MFSFFLSHLVVVQQDVTVGINPLLEVFAEAVLIGQVVNVADEKNRDGIESDCHRTAALRQHNARNGPHDPLVGGDTDPPPTQRKRTNEVSQKTTRRTAAVQTRDIIAERSGSGGTVSCREREAGSA